VCFTHAAVQRVKNSLNVSRCMHVLGDGLIAGLHARRACKQKEAAFAAWRHVVLQLKGARHHAKVASRALAVSALQAAWSSWRQYTTHRRAKAIELQQARNHCAHQILLTAWSLWALQAKMRAKRVLALQHIFTGLARQRCAFCALTRSCAQQHANKS
jgi:hypothetical protein